MALFIVDKEKCTSCAACVAECPATLIRINDPGSAPEPIDGADMMCIDCGHCVAVCPKGALTHRSMKPEECPPVRDEWIARPEIVGHYMRARRSIRSYKKEPVGQDVLEKLIDIARYAPSGHNGQSVRWLILQSSEDVQRASGATIDWMKYLLEEGNPMAQALHVEALIGAWEAGIDIICRNTSHLIVAHAPKQNPIAPTDSLIALSHLELAAPAFGLGACWAGFVQIASQMWPPMQEVLGLPEGNVSHGIMMVGYPKYKYHRLPLRNEAQIIWR